MPDYYYFPVIIISPALAAIIYAMVLRWRKENFAKCLTQSGAMMFGSCHCPRCQAQKAMFDSAWQYVTYIEANNTCPNYDPNWGQKLGLSGTIAFPTWKFPDGFTCQYQDHVLSLDELAALGKLHGANCKY
ncbi:hypothetical protein WOC76_14945 [Methylocystis sp. IM3]|uniref:hypothetical protein n=1 Tax=unclassified Methylocystis TaxID=2625913 RepID=UPI000F9EA43C|nr:MAG: hypothetical protein EKK29_07255 [Hyphomicrobiales bacterium]